MWFFAGFTAISAIPIPATAAVCIISHFVLHAYHAGIRASGLHLYWVDGEICIGISGCRYPPLLHGLYQRLRGSEGPSANVSACGVGPRQVAACIVISVMRPGARRRLVKPIR